MKLADRVSITMLFICSDYISNIHCRNVKVAMLLNIMKIQLQAVLYYISSNTFQVQGDVYDQSGCMDQRIYVGSHIGGTGEMVVQSRKHFC